MPEDTPTLFNQPAQPTALPPELTDRSVAEHPVRGEVLRIVFAGADSGYTVLRLLTPERREVTVTGPLGTVMEGQDLEAWGHWEVHREHGRQFRVTRFKVLQPTTREGIRRYLASGVLPGVGKVYAERIVAAFGERTLEILDHFPARLADVPGLGRKRVQQIREAWASSSQARELHVYLQGLGIGTGHCHRIVQRYGHAAPEIVRQNPYQLAGDIQGIGFLSADRIAANLGIAQDHPLRLQAGIGHVLGQVAEQQGHVCLPEAKLLEAAAEILGVEPAAASLGLQRALLDGSVVADTLGGDGRVLYQRELYAAETGLATALRRLLASTAGAPPPPPRELEFAAKLNAEQRQAVARAFASRLSIITGGPGVGKTTVVGQIVANARRLGRRLLLAAPTGRAAKRLSESCQQEAKTIHRLLQWDPQKGAFVHNQNRPLRGDYLVVDEVSMLDTELAHSLFQAVDPSTRVILVGDRDQLPSVGPGAVLHDLIACGRLPVTALTQIYRQGEHSRIVANAHAVNHGRMPDLKPNPEGVRGDFYWLDQEDPELAADQIARMVAERIPASFHFDPLTDIQVLAPMNKGICGTQQLNQRLQQTLNGAAGRAEFRSGDRLYRVGDRVMQVSNNYDKNVFNGEMGRISGIDLAAKKFQALFDGGPVEYGFHEAEQVRLAYAVTVHKSQGCEFPVVVMPLLSQHFIMLQRNLVYTAMTRAKKLLILVGTRKALALAIHNDRPAARFTRLTERLAP